MEPVKAPFVGCTAEMTGCSQPYELEAGAVQAGEELSGEMAPEEAARVAEMLGVKVAVACHYFTHNHETAEFLAKVPVHDRSGSRQAIAPLPGDTFVIDPAKGMLQLPGGTPAPVLASGGIR